VVMSCHRPFASAPNTPGNSGTGGASLYVAIGNAGSDSPAIQYRRFRLLPGAAQLLAAGSFDGNKFAGVAQITAPTVEFSYSLAAEKSYRLNVRAWQDDQENRAINGEQILETTADTAPDYQILGTGYLVDSCRLAGGGYRFDIVYTRSLDGIDPSEFVLSVQSGPTTPDEVSVPYDGERRYRLEVTDLTHGGEYVFHIEARATGATSLALDNSAGSGDPDITITADAAGPGAITGLRLQER
jgi:hypothetical protein